MSIHNELNNRRNYIYNWRGNPEFRVSELQRLSKYPDGGEVTDESAIQQMTEARDYIQQYHKSPKFKERFENYQKFGDWPNKYGLAVDLINDAASDYSLEVGNKMLEEANFGIARQTGNTMMSIQDRFKSGEHYLLQGETSQPLLDRITRNFKNRPNPETEDLGSHFDPKFNTVWMYKDQPRELGSNVANISAHEFSHRAALSPEYRFAKEVEDFQKAAIRNVQDEHDADIHETKADVDAFRFMLKNAGIYDAGTEDFTIEHLEKAMQDPTIKDDFLFKRLKRLFRDENLVTLMNLIAQAEPVEQNETTYLA